MSATGDEARSLAYVVDAIARIPSELERALAVPMPTLRRAGSVVTSGIGASEGPARLLARRLACTGTAARFVSLGEFATRPVAADRLVVFSQGLSPNARLAFGEEHVFEQRTLVTSVGYGDGSEAKRELLDQLVRRGVVAIPIPPISESGTLVRFVGPTVAALTALRLEEALGGAPAPTAHDAPTAYRTASGEPAEPIDPADPIAIVGAGVSVDELFAARWKILETLLRTDPPVWDALSFAHGPVQAMSRRKLTLLVFETPGAEPLVARLAASIDRDHHRMVRFRADAEGGLRVIEHTARLDGLLAATLRAHPRDLFSWPGSAGECSLYELGEDPPCDR